MLQTYPFLPKFSSHRVQSSRTRAPKEKLTFLADPVGWKDFPADQPVTESMFEPAHRIGEPGDPFSLLGNIPTSALSEV